jgi:hypothetical protein
VNYDIFNGDADGIIALLQLRLAEPKNSELITGVKRDISLLKNVDVKSGDSITALDISMEKNIDALKNHLEVGANVLYVDHHRSGDIPLSDSLTAHIDLDANTCTSLIVDELLSGKYHLWAITGAYGDNLIAKGDELANAAELTSQQSEQLKELGTLINYNGYGSHVDDLHFHPKDLYLSLLPYESPFDVINDTNSAFYQLQTAYKSDMENALAIVPRYNGELFALFELPNQAWARRISGVYGNLLANGNPCSAHGVLTENKEGTYTVSLRAPLNNKQGAGDICSQFATGGGRAAAAGVNALPKEQVDKFIDIVEGHYKS